MYKVPTNLLSTKNSKTIKGEKFGYTTYIMYLAPHKQNSYGRNLCSHATTGCSNACLFKSGADRFNMVKQGKINKSDYFIENREAFMFQLYKEIEKIQSTHNSMTEDVTYRKNGKVLRHRKFAIRLNGTSDIPFENIKVMNGKNIFELFPNVQFYDYTKNHNRFNNHILPNNYHLTFSRSETNHKHVVDILNRGFNVAVVFAVKDESELPATYLGYPVVNGDESDLRFLDDENVIVGLKYKMMTGKGTKGVNAKMFEENAFLVHVLEEWREKETVKKFAVLA